MHRSYERLCQQGSGSMAAAKNRSPRGKTLRALSYITVEPAVIGSLFVIYTYATLGKQYIFLRLAQDYNLTQTSRETSCNGTADEIDNSAYLLLQQVSAETSSWVFYLALASFVPAIFSTVAFGSWSDNYGRKLPLLSSLFGFIILILGYVIVINLDAPVPYLLIGHVLCGLLGDTATLLACSFSYIADITQPRKRTFRITVVEACLAIGGVVAALSGGVWLDRKGFISPFWFLLACTVADFVYIAIRLDSNDTGFKTLKHLFSLEPFVRMYEALKPQGGDKDRHRSILLFLAAFFILGTAKSGLNGIIVVYEIGLPFCWNPVQVGISQAIIPLGYFFILPLVKVFCGAAAEVKLIVCGLLSQFVGCLVLAFAVSDWMIYFGLTIQILYLMPSPILRSQLSRLATHNETGPVFALQSCVGNVAHIVASALYNGVFAATVDSSIPGAAFLLSPVLMLIFGLLYRAGYKKCRGTLFVIRSTETPIDDGAELEKRKIESDPSN